MRNSILLLIFFQALAVTRVAAQTPAGSFADLQPMLAVGQQVMVSDQHGRSIHGRLVSIAGDELVMISMPRFIGRSSRLTFSESAVTTVRLVDSTSNGFALGALAGFVVALAVLCPSEDGCSGGGAAAFVAIPAIFAGGAAGYFIDRISTTLVYDRPARTPTVTLTPVAARGRVAVVARIGF
jgi:hypothetical protein